MGSFFSKNHLQYREVVKFGYLWLSKMFASGVATFTGHSTKTISIFIGHFRQLDSDFLNPDANTIGGPGMIVRIIDSKLGK